MPTVSYPVAWQREAGPRLVGSASVEGDALVLVGHEVGARNGQERLVLVGGDTECVELRRSSGLPVLSMQHDGRSLMIELLMGGWGAAHHLADTLARPLGPAAPAASSQVRTMVFAARILPGRRADLERMLNDGLPAELSDEGACLQEVSIGDEDVVVILTAPETMARRLTRTGLGLGDTVSSPRLLTQTYSWRRNGGSNPAAAS
jgi:hypothetical protein